MGSRAAWGGREASTGPADVIRSRVRKQWTNRLPPQSVAFENSHRSSCEFFEAAACIAPKLQDVPRSDARTRQKAVHATLNIAKNQWLRKHNSVVKQEKSKIGSDLLFNAQNFFNIIKEDSADVITVEDMLVALQKSGMRPDPALVEQVVKDADQNHDGFLDREEFITLLFSEDMRERFFSALQTKGQTMLTIPLWSLAVQRQNRLDRCYNEFGEQRRSTRSLSTRARRPAEMMIFRPHEPTTPKERIESEMAAAAEQTKAHRKEEQRRKSSTFPRKLSNASRSVSSTSSLKSHTSIQQQNREELSRRRDDSHATQMRASATTGAY